MTTDGDTPRTAQQIADHLTEIGRIGGESAFRHIDQLWDYIETLPEYDREASENLYPGAFAILDGHVIRDVTDSVTLPRELSSWTGNPEPGRTYWAPSADERIHTMTTTDEILGQLNAWDETHDYTTDNIFDSLIYGLGIMDETATNAIDGNGWGDRFVTTTGQIIRYDLQAKRWYDAGQYEG